MSFLTGLPAKLWTALAAIGAFLALLGGAAAMAAPAFASLNGVHWAVGVAVVVGAVGLAALWLLKRQRAA